MSYQHLFRADLRRIQQLYLRENFLERDCLDPDDPEHMGLIVKLMEFRQVCLYNGWEPIPCRGKNGLLANFTTGLITPLRVSQETGSALDKLNTSFRTGYNNGIDNDLRVKEHADIIDSVVDEMFGRSPLRRYGSKGAMSVYRNPDQLHGKLQLTTADGTRVFEVLGRGFQFVGYGRHPLGMNYKWQDAHPAVFKFNDLPIISTDRLKELMIAVQAELEKLGYTFKKKEEIRPKTMAPVAQRVQYNNDYEDTTALCRAALEVIPNDADREEWVSIGMAVKDAGLDYTDWAEWCHKWEGGSNSEENITIAWNSFHPHQVTYKTLLAKADLADKGWRFRYRERRRLERYEYYAKQMKNWPYHTED